VNGGAAGTALQVWVVLVTSACKHRNHVQGPQSRYGGISDLESGPARRWQTPAVDASNFKVVAAGPAPAPASLITKVGFRREGPCDGFSDSNPSWAPLLSTLRGRFQTTIQSQMARTWRREFRPEHAFVRIKMLFLERVTTSSREHAKDEI